MIQRNTAAVRGLGMLVLSIAATLAATSVQAAGLSVVMAPSLDKARQDVGSALTFTMRNDSAEPISVLKWQTPFYGIEHDLFDVNVGGMDSDYNGRWIKRGAPGPDDWMTLQPGEAKSVEIDLSEAYDFSASGQYQMKYAIDLTEAGDAHDHGGRRDVQSKRIESFPILRWVDGTGQPNNYEETFPIGMKALNPTPAFESCSSTRQSSINTALASARSYGINSDNYFASKTYSTVTTRYKTWFGTATSSRFSSVKGNYDRIEYALSNTKLTFNCSCTSSAYAYVYPTQPYRVYLCNAFWSAPNTGTDSRAGTIIHELSHFDVLGNTDDIVYGQSGAKSLAISNPSQAIKNADSHEYFSENTPFQN
ncbi:MAG TPA: M35 family metallo-endopeptidase [Pseudomonadota bacterium]|jgi:peptidyl-Lys metalloendopeptidase|nr:M35 family metallo-endopeptidase [Pseudomonadota bacterium]